MKSKWTYETCYQEASKYKSKSELQKYAPTVYNKSRIKGWLKDYTWLGNHTINLEYSKIYSVYKYEFPDKVIYIGLSMQPTSRHWQHKQSIFKSSVRDYAESMNVNIPNMEILESNLTQQEAQIKEDYYIKYYKNLNYKLLNKGKTGLNIGSVGSLNRKWTKKRCFNEAIKYKSKIAFRHGNYAAYLAAKRHKWIKDFIWFKRPVSFKLKWTKESVFIEAKKYISRSEFQKKCIGAYIVARKNKWLDQFTWFKIRQKWTYENCVQEAKKYKSRKEFKCKCSSAYEYAKKHNILDLLFNDQRKVPHSKYTYEVCIAESKKYTSRSQFQEMCYTGYNKARRNNWLKDMYWLKKVERQRDEKGRFKRI